VHPAYIANHPTLGRQDKLETRRIGSLEVSVVGLGCNNFGWRIDAEASAAAVNAALDAGIDFFDTADIYGAGASEEFLGRALGSRRNEVLIATKFGMKMDDQRHGAHPDYVRRAVEDSLRRLGTDRIDLYQLHQPDAQVPIAETLGALDELVRAGKVREVGCSNFSGDQLRAAEAAVPAGGARFVSVQNQYSMVHREPEAEVIPECVRLRIAFLPFFPLANGLLTGKYRRGQPLPEGSRARDGFGPKVFTDANLALVESLAGFAAGRGHSMLELAVSWLAAQPAVASVIAGAKSPEQVKTNASAAAWRLSAEDLAAIEAILTQAPQAQ
jgi:aryl-alcohol dehydrogenase-like predicted oxidoreductase